MSWDIALHNSSTFRSKPTSENTNGGDISKPPRSGLMRSSLERSPASLAVLLDCPCGQNATEGLWACSQMQNTHHPYTNVLYTNVQVKSLWCCLSCLQGRTALAKFAPSFQRGCAGFCAGQWNYYFCLYCVWALCPMTFSKLCQINHQFHYMDKHQQLI